MLINRTERQWWEASGHCLVSRQSRGSIFTVFGLGLEGYCLGLGLGLGLALTVWSWSCPYCLAPYCLGLMPRVQYSSRHLLKSASNLPTYQKPSWQSTWQWSIVRTLTQMNSQPLYLPTIPRSVATLLEVMVCACYFCTGRTYTHKVASLLWQHQAKIQNTFRNVNVAQM